MKAKLMATLVVLSLLFGVVCDVSARGPATNCPVGDVRVNVSEDGVTLVTSDKSAIVSGNANAVSWQASSGYTITQVCVQVGEDDFYLFYEDGGYTAKEEPIVAVTVWTKDAEVLPSCSSVTVSVTDLKGGNVGFVEVQLQHEDGTLLVDYVDEQSSVTFPNGDWPLREGVWYAHIGYDPNTWHPETATRQGLVLPALNCQLNFFLAKNLIYQTYLPLAPANP